MKHYSQAAVQRTTKIQTLRQANSLAYGQEVIMRAMAKKKAGYQAADILGISCRQMRRMKERWEKRGYDGLFDRRRGKPSPKRVPMAFDKRGCRKYCACIRRSTTTST